MHAAHNISSNEDISCDKVGRAILSAPPEREISTREPESDFGAVGTPRPTLNGRLALAVGLVFFAVAAFAEQRFPPPEFESGYKLPQTTTPAARALWLEYGDVLVL